MSNRLLSALAVLVVLGGALLAWHHFYPGHNDDPLNPGQAVVIPDFDGFQRDLASRVTTQFHVPAESVVVAPASYDIGTLLDPVQALPSDSTDCIPAPLPKAVAAEHLFPAYQLSSNTAATTTLGSDALQNISSASLSLAHNSSVTYAIQNVQVQFMDVKTVDQLGALGACGDYVKQHPRVRLIRGLVTGKVSFTLKVDNPSSMSAKVSKLGGVSASTDPNNSTVTVADDQPSEILQMLWVYDPAVTPVAAAAAGPAAAPIVVPTASPSHDPATSGPNLDALKHEQHIEHHTGFPSPGGAAAPAPAAAPPPAPPVPTPAPSQKVAQGQPHVFLQQDASDSSGAGSRIAAALKAAWPEAVVEGRVERIPTAKMPTAIQIRFFNAADQPVAAICRDRLKAATGLEGRIVRIGLAAPAGQLEVWLPRN